MVTQKNDTQVGVVTMVTQKNDTQVSVVTMVTQKNDTRLRRYYLMINALSGKITNSDGFDQVKLK